MDRKSTKRPKQRPDRPKKRRFHGNRFTVEPKPPTTSPQKPADTKDPDHGYRIIALSVFTALSNLLVCKDCKETVTFIESEALGLGFKIAIQCKCGENYIDSSPMIEETYEVNQRIVFIMKLLGVGKEGLNLFCGLMDLCQGVQDILYYTTLENIHSAAKTVFDLMTKNAVNEEKQKTEECGNPLELTVSSNATWKKRGLTSNFGCTSLFGKYTGKVIDLIVKSSHNNQSSTNINESSDKSSISCVKEMFQRSKDLHHVTYTKYITDHDSKTFKALVEDKPYGNDVLVKKDLLSDAQNNSESFNAIVWRLAPEYLHSGTKHVETAAYMAAGIFNEGFTAVLHVMMTIGIVIGEHCSWFINAKDKQRLQRSARLSLESTIGAKIQRQTEFMGKNEFYEEDDGVI